MDASLPLSRYTVLDLTRARSGPTAVRQLADWGANVIKIEPTGDQDEYSSPFDKRHGPDFQNLHRNKRSITLDLKAPEGLAVFRRMAEKADVVIENFRPGVKHRLGIDYESLRKSIRAWSMPAFPASARKARTRTGRDWTRWCKAWAV